MPVLSIYGIRVVEVVRFLHVLIYKGFAFPLVRNNKNHFTDVIWARRKEANLCLNRPLNWAEDSCPKIKIQEELDLCLFA